MLVYTSDIRKLRKAAIKEVLFTFLPLAILPLVDLFIKTDLVWDSYYPLAGVFALMALIDAFGRSRLLRLTFDTEREEIILETTSIPLLIKKKVLPFSETTLQASSPVTKSQRKWNPLTLTFYRNRKIMLVLSSAKDGLSLNTLEEIRENVAKYCQPISSN
ncbi:hypothetical protein [Rufibacter roseolus]|uniref:hypothetical protein n=1 Tax=Rufibacter roseolus TaxID=2817375 RepID=UPI001B30BD2D|nr:hypothetical protein [Rufibacter roseolus]